MVFYLEQILSFEILLPPIGGMKYFHFISSDLFKQEQLASQQTFTVSKQK